MNATNLTTRPEIVSLVVTDRENRIPNFESEPCIVSDVNNVDIFLGTVQEMGWGGQFCTSVFLGQNVNSTLPTVLILYERLCVAHVDTGCSYTIMN